MLTQLEPLAIPLITNQAPLHHQVHVLLLNQNEFTTREGAN